MLELEKDILESLSPKDLKEALGIFEKLEEIGEVVPIALYLPHEKQRTWHLMRQRFKAFFGGNQSGKTTAGLADNLIQALDREYLPDHLLPFKFHEGAFFCRIFTTDLITLQLSLLEKLKTLVPQDALIGGSWETGYDKQLRVLRFKNGSIFQFMTYEQERRRMGGATLHRVHYDEEPPYSIRGENAMRLMRLGGDELLTMTPLEGFTWTYDEIWEKRGKEIKKDVFESKDIGTVLVDIEDNPAIDDKKRDYTLSLYPEDERKARKTGRFIPLEGMIFKRFNETQHVVEQLPQLPQNKNVIIGIDPGFGEACAVIWTYLSPNDKMVIFDELFLQGQIIEQVCEQIKLVNALHNIEPIYYVIDPHARNKNPQTGRSDQQEFADHGVVCIPGQDSVRTGLNAMATRLENDALFIWDNCVNTIREFKKYRWKAQKRDDMDTKPKPVKKDDHLLDALRYVVMSRPYVPVEEVEHPDRTHLQQLMYDDQLKALRPQKKSEFGGIFY